MTPTTINVVAKGEKEIVGRRKNLPGRKNDMVICPWRKVGSPLQSVWGVHLSVGVVPQPT